MKVTRPLRSTALIIGAGVVVGALAIHAIHICNPAFNPADYDPCFGPPLAVVAGSLFGPVALAMNLLTIVAIAFGLHFAHTEPVIERILRVWLFLACIGSAAIALQIHYVITHGLSTFSAGAL